MPLWAFELRPVSPLRGLLLCEKGTANVLWAGRVAPRALRSTPPADPARPSCNGRLAAMLSASIPTGRN